MDNVAIVGRVIVGLYFLFNAYNHLIKGSHMVGYASAKGVPSPKLAIYGSGVLLLAGSLSFISGMFMTWGALALLAFLVPVTFKMHAFWKEADGMTKMNEKIAFLKNVALIGFTLMTF